MEVLGPPTSKLLTLKLSTSGPSLVPSNKILEQTLSVMNPFKTQRRHQWALSSCRCHFQSTLDRKARALTDEMMTATSRISSFMWKNHCIRPFCLQDELLPFNCASAGWLLLDQPTTILPDGSNSRLRHLPDGYLPCQPTAPCRMTAPPPAELEVYEESQLSRSESCRSAQRSH